MSISAQSDLKKRSSVFFELAGSGGFGSINYERTFFKKPTTELNWRVGLSWTPIDSNNGSAIILPIMIHSNFGKKNHKLELGIGQGITFTTKGSYFILGTASLGYRYQSDEKPWFFRATYTPLISYLFDRQWQHWAGVSIGYTLNSKKT